MAFEPQGYPIDRITLAVWLGMVVTGAAAWFASGTALVGGLIVFAVLLAAAAPAGALYAACAALPLIFHPVDVGSLQLGLLEIGLLSTIAGFVLRNAYDLVESRRPPDLAWLTPYASWTLPALVMLVGTLSLFTMPFEMHRAEAIRTWRWVIVEPLALFALARWAISRHGPIPLSFAISIPATLVAGTAIWQLVESTSNFAVDEVQRSTATYLHPNNLALYLERALFLLFIPAVLLPNRARLPLVAMSAIVTAGILTTFSRGALLGLVVGCAVLLIAHPMRFGWRVLAISSLAAAGLFLLVAGKRFTGSDSSGFLATREYLWRDAAGMIRDFPISGIGLDQFLWLHQSRYVDPHIWSERYTSHPHNLLLDSWLSLGAAGLALLAAFSVAGIWLVWNVRRGARSMDPWQLGALACLGAGVGHGLVDNGYFLADLSAMTWLSIAIVLTPGKSTNRYAVDTNE